MDKKLVNMKLSSTEFAHLSDEGKKIWIQEVVQEKKMYQESPIQKVSPAEYESFTMKEKRKWKREVLRVRQKKERLWVMQRVSLLEFPHISEELKRNWVLKAVYQRNMDQQLLQRKFSPVEFAYLNDEEKVIWLLEAAQEKKKKSQQSLHPKFVSPAEFKYLTPQEKKKWVLCAVLIQDDRQRFASEQYLFPVDSAHDETELTDVGGNSAGHETSETIEFDLTDLFVEELRDEKFPPKNRVMQLFSVRVDFKSDKPGRLYGCIEAKAYGWLDYVSFFNRGEDESESQPICNKGLVSLTDQSPYRLISASREFNLNVQLFVLVDGLDLKASLLELVWNCSRYEINKNFNYFETTIIKEMDGCARLYYIVLDNALEATVEVLFETDHDSVLAYGKVVAYYGNLDSYCLPRDEDDADMESSQEYETFKGRPDEVDYFKATLFEASKSDDVLLKPGKVQLRRSKIIVPNGGSLIIEVHLLDSRDHDKEILGDVFEFQSKVKECSTGCLEGIGCKMNLKVDWNCTAEEDAAT